jgi:hypothetical protein
MQVRTWRYSIPQAKPVSRLSSRTTKSRFCPLLLPSYLARLKMHGILNARNPRQRSSCIDWACCRKDFVLTRLLTLQRPLRQIMKRETLYLHCRPIYRGIFLAIKYIASCPPNIEPAMSCSPRLSACQPFAHSSLLFYSRRTNSLAK